MSFILTLSSLAGHAIECNPSVMTCQDMSIFQCAAGEI
jgi:hypothetical protein